MTKKLVWRLGKLPSPDEVRELVKDKIISNDEAREILFTSEEVTERDKKSLESEIKFLRELVEKLAHSNQNTIFTTIKEVEPPYKRYPWYDSYIVWYNSSNQNSLNGTISNNFSDIITF